jgi:hypothetical protein
MVHWSAAKRLGNSLPALGDIAYNLESLRIAVELRQEVKWAESSDLKAKPET